MAPVSCFIVFVLATAVSSQTNNEIPPMNDIRSPDTSKFQRGSLMGDIFAFADVSAPFSPQVGEISGFPPGSTTNDQVLPPPTNNTPVESPKAASSIEGPAFPDPGPAFPDEAFPSDFPSSADASDPTLDSEIIDLNSLFPPETASTGQTDPGQQNQDFVLAFLPSFPKGDKVVNLNTGKTLQEPGNTASFPPNDTLPDKPLLPLPETKLDIPSARGPSDKLPAAKSQPSSPVDTKVVPLKPERPISSLPVNAMKPIDVTKLNPMNKPTAEIPTSGGAQAQIRRKKPKKRPADRNQVPASWVKIFPNGQRPKKLNNAVKMGETKEIAPLTPVQAMLTHASLVSFGKDRAMRRMLINQRREARKKVRNQRKQRQQVPQRNSPVQEQNQQNLNNRNNRNTEQGTERRNQNNRNRRNQGQKKLRRSRRQSGPWLPRNRRRKSRRNMRTRRPRRQRQKQRRGRKRLFSRRRNLGTQQLQHYPGNDDAESSQNVPPARTITGQIIAESRQHITSQVFPRKQLFPRIFSKDDKRILTQRPRFSKGNVDAVGSGNVRPDQAITGQIIAESRKHITSQVFPREQSFPRKSSKKDKIISKQRPRFSKGAERIISQMLGNIPLHVPGEINFFSGQNITESGHLVSQTLPKRRVFPQKSPIQEKRFLLPQQRMSKIAGRKFPRLFGNIHPNISSDGSAVLDRTATDQIIAESGKHFASEAVPGTHVLPGKPPKQERRFLVHQQKMSKVSGMDFPRDVGNAPQSVPDGGITALDRKITDKRKAESGTHIVSQTLPDGQVFRRMFPTPEKRFLTQQQPMSMDSGMKFSGNFGDAPQSVPDDGGTVVDGKITDKTLVKSGKHLGTQVLPGGRVFKGKPQGQEKRFLTHQQRMSVDSGMEFPRIFGNAPQNIPVDGRAVVDQTVTDQTITEVELNDTHGFNGKPPGQKRFLTHQQRMGVDSGMKFPRIFGNAPQNIPVDGRAVVDQTVTDQTITEVGLHDTHGFNGKPPGQKRFLTHQQRMGVDSGMKFPRIFGNAPQNIPVDGRAVVDQTVTDQTISEAELHDTHGFKGKPPGQKRFLTHQQRMGVDSGGKFSGKFGKALKSDLGDRRTVLDQTMTHQTITEAGKQLDIQALPGSHTFQRKPQGQERRFLIHQQRMSIDTGIKFPRQFGNAPQTDPGDGSAVLDQQIIDQTIAEAGNFLDTQSVHGKPPGQERRILIHQQRMSTDSGMKFSGNFGNTPQSVPGDGGTVVDRKTTDKTLAKSGKHLGTQVLPGGRVFQGKPQGQEKRFLTHQQRMSVGSEIKFPRNFGNAHQNVPVDGRAVVDQTVTDQTITEAELHDTHGFKGKPPGQERFLTHQQRMSVDSGGKFSGKFGNASKSDLGDRRTFLDQTMTRQTIAESGKQLDIQALPGSHTFQRKPQGQERRFLLNQQRISIDTGMKFPRQFGNAPKTVSGIGRAVLDQPITDQTKAEAGKLLDTQGVHGKPPGQERRFLIHQQRMSIDSGLKFPRQFGNSPQNLPDDGSALLDQPITEAFPVDGSTVLDQTVTGHIIAESGKQTVSEVFPGEHGFHGKNPKQRKRFLKRQRSSKGGAIQFPHKFENAPQNVPGDGSTVMDQTVTDHITAESGKHTASQTLPTSKVFPGLNSQTLPAGPVVPRKTSKPEKHLLKRQQHLSKDVAIEFPTKLGNAALNVQSDVNTVLDQSVTSEIIFAK